MSESNPDNVDDSVEDILQEDDNEFEEMEEEEDE